jgi:hypothetical protein
MPGNHPVHAVGRELRKLLKAAFPGATIDVSTSVAKYWGGSIAFPPRVDVYLWKGPSQPSLTNVEAVLGDYQNSPDYTFQVRSLAPDERP